MFTADLLPEHMQNDDFLKGFIGKPFEAFAKSAIETKKGYDGRVPIPKDANDTEARTAFVNRLRPETPEGYNITIPDGTNWKPEGVSKVTGLLHKVGCPTFMAQELFNGWADLSKKELDASEERYRNLDANSVTDLKTHFGDGFDESMGLYTRFLRAAGGDDLVDHFKALGLHHDPKTVKALTGIAKGMKEDSWSGNAAPVVASIGDLDNQIKSFYDGPKDSAFMDINHRDHRATLKHVEGLLAQKQRRSEMANT